MKKIIISLLSLVLVACTSQDIKYANLASQRQDYISALAYLEPHLKSDTNIDEKVKLEYRKVWEEAQVHYNRLMQNSNLGEQAKATEEQYQIEKKFSSLSNPIRSAFPEIQITSHDLEKKQKEVAKAYYLLGESLGTHSYETRVKKYMAYSKAKNYSQGQEISLEKSFNKAYQNLEKNLKVQVQGSSNSDLQSLLKSKTENLLLKEEIFEFSKQSPANIFLQIQVQSYQFREEPRSFTTKTEYKKETVPTTSIQNGVAQTKMVEKSFPYQALQYTKTRSLEYFLSYQLVDRDGKIVFSETLPIKIEDTKTWKQYIPLSIDSLLNLPKSEAEPRNLSKNEMLEKSFSPFLKQLKEKINNLKHL